MLSINFGQLPEVSDSLLSLKCLNLGAYGSHLLQSSCKMLLLQFAFCMNDFFATAWS